MNNNYFKTVAVLLLLAVTTIAMPNVALAQSAIQFQPRSTGELIAYLYGRIVQLQEIQKMIQNGSSQSSTQSAFDYILIETQKADDITDVTAYLRGEVVLFGKATGKVWFEYGQDDDFLGFKTRQTTVRTSYDRAVRTQVTKLEEDERYYFRMVSEDKNKVVTYGSVFSFHTDESED